MDDTTIKIIIGTAAAVVTAIATTLAAKYTANQKIKELQISFAQKLQENYLANARQYTRSVYVPLSIALETLRREFEDFRIKLEAKNRSIDPIAEGEFIKSVNNYLTVIYEMFKKGADAFMTTDLDERLRAFNSFLEASLKENTLKKQVILQYQLRLPGTVTIGTSGRIERITSGRVAKMMRLGRVKVDFLGIGFTYEDEVVLAAQINSKDFEQRMLTDIPAIKYLIKEVTLGCHSQTV